MAQDGPAVIIGVGPGLGAALARRFAKAGMAVVIAARDAAKLDAVRADVAAEGGDIRAITADATIEADVARLFQSIVADPGVPELVVYNASRRWRGGIVDTPAEDFEASWRVSCFGGFLVGREAARLMTARGSGTILFTGASASVKGFPRSHAFAVGKFGLRALAQSMARELGPRGIHVAHVVIDGGIMAPARQARLDEMGPDSLLDADAIAETYYRIHRQHRSAWTFETEVRPWVEKF